MTLNLEAFLISKKEVTMNDIVESLKWRYACKAFNPAKKISEKDLGIVLEALRLTPSSYGLQPWKFILVENKEVREQLVPASWNQKQVLDASHLVVFAAPKKIDEAFIDNYIENIAATRDQDVSELAGMRKMMMNIAFWEPKAQYQWAKNQSYIALGNLMTVCADMRIDSCPMEGFKPAEYDKILGLEKMGLTSLVVCPIGYRDESDKYIKLAKVRHPIEDLVIKI